MCARLSCAAAHHLQTHDVLVGTAHAGGQLHRRHGRRVVHFYLEAGQSIQQGRVGHGDLVVRIESALLQRGEDRPPECSGASGEVGGS